MSKKISDKLSDKFSGVFSRDKPKEQTRSDKSYFNEAYFECRLSYHPHKLSLMKVEANISVGPDAGMPMMVNCRWLVKKGHQLTEIQGIKSSCYQPCIEDVGCSICVQIEPLIEGKIYSGATITKETGVLELGASLQTQLTDLKKKLYYLGEQVSFGLKVQGFFSNESHLSSLEYPQDGFIQISKWGETDFDILVKTQDLCLDFWITKEYPQVEFIRKSYNSVIITFAENQSMRLAFKENTDRQILGLLLKTLTLTSSLNWPIKLGSLAPHQDQNSLVHEEKLYIKAESQKIEHRQEVQNKEEAGETQVSQQKHKKESKSAESLPNPVPSQQGEEYLERINSLSEELKRTKGQYRELLKSYGAEQSEKAKKQSELKERKKQIQKLMDVQTENEGMKKRIAKLGQDARFYKNEVTLLKKSLSQKQEELNLLQEEKKAFSMKIDEDKELKKQIVIERDLGNQEFEKKAEQLKRANNELLEQNEHHKGEIERLQNQLIASKRKIQSLCQEKQISPAKHESQTHVEDSEKVRKELEERKKQIQGLEFKLSNLQMLLRVKSGEKGKEMMSFQKIINSLTEAVTEKEQQLIQIKAINKELLKKLKEK